MAETKILENEDEDNRLSSLPDEVLTNILSFLPIHSAATTSVLSHRWRHLWTGVTRVQLVADLISNSTDIIDHILSKLTSRKLHNFTLDVNDLSNYQESNASVSVSWFREVCSRNVENILFTAQPPDIAGPFCIPAFLVNSQSLVTLNLSGIFEWPKIDNISLHLPNLKVFILDGIDGDIPIWLETLIRSSPLLEVLDLVFNLFTYSELSSTVLNIIAPNLKSLSISLDFCFLSLMQHPRVSIDAPKLSGLRIRDCISIYNFIINPNTLVSACIDLKNYGDWLDLEDNEDDEENNVLLHREQREYLVQMTKFVAGLSSVDNLKLKVESPTNIFKYRSSVSLLIYSNVTRLETEGPMQLLNHLRCFPNLEHLVVGLWSASSQASHFLRTLGFPMEHNYWSLPNSIPDCLVSKLKTIQLTEIQGTDDTLSLLAYILSNANVLKKLCISLRVNLKNESEEAYTVWKECHFCRALFKLSRRSSTCEVVFSGNYYKASGDALQDGYLTCRMYVGNKA